MRVSILSECVTQALTQAVISASSAPIWVPAMFLVGLMFGALWVTAIVLGRKGDAAAAAHRAGR